MDARNVTLPAIGEYRELIKAVGAPVADVDHFGFIARTVIFTDGIADDHAVYATGPEAIMADECESDFGAYADHWHLMYGDPAGEMDLLRVQYGASVQRVAMIVKALLMVRAL